MAVEASLVVLRMPTNIRVQIVARTAYSIGMHSCVVAATQGAPKASQESESLARVHGSLMECHD